MLLLNLGSSFCYYLVLFIITITLHWWVLCKINETYKMKYENSTYLWCLGDTLAPGTARPALWQTVDDCQPVWCLRQSEKGATYVSAAAPGGLWERRDGSHVSR